MISVITPSIRPRYLDITQRTLEAQTFQDFEWLVEIGMPDRGFTLPSDFNKMLRRARGETIVILEDFIQIDKEALALINDWKVPDTLMAITFPVQHSMEWDWRFNRTGAIEPNEWEIDFAAAPRSMFFDVGGFDEEFCKGWSWENVELAWRAQAAGYTFYCMHPPLGYAFNHDALMPHPFRNTLPPNDTRAHQSYLSAKTGSYKLGYL